MKLAAILVALAAFAAHAQTEDDLMRWVNENKPLADSGAMSQLEFHREMHRRISIIPAESYQFKLQNLRWIGRRIDILEEQEAGKITKAQAERKLAEADATVEAENLADKQARERAEAQRAEAIRLQQQQAAAQDEAARRALALQILQQQRPMMTPPTAPITPYQIQPRRGTNCRTTNIAGTLYTNCD